MLGKHWLKLQDKIVATCMSYLSTGGPCKECGTNKLPPTRRIREGSKGERRHQSLCPTNLSESFSLESLLAELCAQYQKGPWVRMVSQRNPEINLITIKLETVSHVAEKFSWVSFPCCSPSGYPFPIKAFALSGCVSPCNIHLRVSDKNPLSGPRRSSSSCNESSLRFFYSPFLLEVKH